MIKPALNPIRVEEIFVANEGVEGAGITLVSSVLAVFLTVFVVLISMWIVGSRRLKRLKTLRGRFPEDVIVAVAVQRNQRDIFESVGTVCVPFDPPRNMVAILRSTSISFWIGNPPVVAAALDVNSVAYGAGVAMGPVVSSPALIAHISSATGRTDLPLFVMRESLLPRGMSEAGLKELAERLSQKG
jgi:hypothetical protein